MYKNKEFSSEFLNIDKDGTRLNSTKISSNVYNKNIWFSGGSNIFGVTNADEQTVPAYLEKYLEKNYGEKFF